jgi:ATP-dependent DNA helicase RecQ
VPDDFDLRSLDLLHRLTGRPDSAFRDDQLEAIRALVEGHRRVLVVQRTGWGKSAVYFLATRLLRDQGSGPTLLVSPLLALMRNQVEAAQSVGLRAVTVNYQNRDEWPAIKAAIDADEVDLLLISAQRLANPEFQREVLPVIGQRSGLLVVDEAHCISDWGHDFNPDYRRISRVLDLLPAGVPVLACTATANDRVVADIETQLGRDLVTLRGPLDREGLELHVVDLPSQASRLAWLSETLGELDGSGIVYCLTVADTERVAAWLRKQGFTASAYSGATPPDQRLQAEQALLANEIKVLVATSALGMGFDKPDLGFVIHFQSPGSPVHYYQQVGRAGRQLDRSLGVLLAGHEDEDIQNWFIKTAFPPRELAEQVVELLAADGASMTLTEIEAEVNIRHSRLEAMLKVLEVEGAVEREGSRWRRTLRPWEYDQDRVGAVTQLRRDEQQLMRDYRDTTDCRMELLRRALDDPAARPCGICDTCRGTRMDRELPPALVAAAHDHLRKTDIVLTARQRMPAGMGGTIPADEQLTSGRALAWWADGGWGGLVRQGRQDDDRFSDELVEAAAALVGRWAPDPAPRWVTGVPSLRHPTLVDDVARRLADRLGLPFAPSMTRSSERPEQRLMENSAQQAANVAGAFVGEPELPSGPVLLVDDIWDSGWTMTIATRVLGQAGVESVHGLVLARSMGD